MPTTRISIENQTDSIEFDAQVEEAIINSASLDSKFDTSSGHHHDGADSRKVNYNDLDGIPSSFAPSAHAHGTVSAPGVHTPMGPDDHHSSIEAGLSVIPDNVTISGGPGSYLELPDGTYIRFGDTTQGARIEYDNILNKLTVKNWGSGTSGFHILNTINDFTIESPNINIGSTSSTINFKTASLNADNWEITGSGAASFVSVNGVLINTSGISNVSYFNGVEILSGGSHSKLSVGNNTYQINHSTHQQNTDTGTSQSSFVIFTGGNKLILSSNNYSPPSNSESAIYNDTFSEKALVIAGNAVDTGTKTVKIKDKLYVAGDILQNGKSVATYEKDGISTIIQDFATSTGYIKIGEAVIQWGTNTVSGTSWTTITFSKAYGIAPSISAACKDSSGATWKTRNITATQFDIQAIGASSASMCWIAIGQG